MFAHHKKRNKELKINNNTCVRQQSGVMAEVVMTPNPYKQKQRVTQESLKCSLGALCNLYPSFFISTQINIALPLGRTKSLRGDFSQASLWTGGGPSEKSNHGKQFNSFSMLQCITLHSLAPERKPFSSF